MAKKKNPATSINFESTLGLDDEEFRKKLKEDRASIDATGKDFVKLGQTGDDATKKLATSIDSLNKHIDSLEQNGSRIGNVFKGVFKLVVESAAIGAALIKPAIEVDNYLGTLNQKLANDGLALERYGKALLDVQAIAGKDLRYGQAPSEIKEIQFGFAKNASQDEKYGANAEANFRGEREGVGGLNKLMGLNTQESIQVLEGWHKQLGITYEGMGPFSTRLAAMTQQSNLTSKEIVNLNSQIAGLGISYNLTGESAKRLTENTMSMAIGLSNAGIDAQNFISKMNEGGKTGSEAGLISDLLLGLNSTGNKQDQLKAHQEAAKKVIAMFHPERSSINARTAKLFIESGASGLMPDTDLETVSRLARGAFTESGRETPSQKAAEVTYGLERQAREGTLGKYHRTAEQTYQQSEAVVNSLLASKFKAAVDDFKSATDKFNNGVGGLDKWLKDHGLDNMGGAGLALASAAVPVLGGVGWWGAKKLLARVAGGGASAVADGSMLGLGAEGVATTAGGVGLAAGLGTAAAGGAVGYGAGRLLGHAPVPFTGGQTVDDRVTSSFEKDLLGSNFNDNEAGLKAVLARKNLAKTVAELGQGAGFTRTDGHGEPHRIGSAHDKNMASDFSIKGKSAAELNALDALMKSQGRKGGLETTGLAPAGYTGKVIRGNANAGYTAPHMHYEDTNESLAENNSPKKSNAPDLHTVIDKQANVTLDKIFNVLTKKFDELISHSAEAGQHTTPHPHDVTGRAINSALAGH